MKRLPTAAVALALVAGITGLSGLASGVASAEPGAGPAAGPGDHSRPLLDRPMAGAAAVRALGDDLPLAAQRNRMSPERLVRLLTEDPTTRVSPSGRVLYVDEGPASRVAAPDVADPAYPYDQTFTLHSRPGADRTIYLDFDGATVSGTEWNSAGYGLPDRSYLGWSLDSDYGSFVATERAFIQDVWARVAEDYAPFDVDVTTQDPGSAALVRSSQSDQKYGARALITDDEEPWETLCDSRCSGVAFLEVFNDWADAPGTYQPAWIFGLDVGSDNQWMADVISHEVGHNLGLEHDGTLTQDYYSGQGVWQPIMGNGFRPLSQFSGGDYLGANNHQDDFAVMQSFGAPLRPDDHGNSPAAATSVASRLDAVIGSRTDIDWFKATQACAGPFSITVDPAAIGPNLDVGLAVQTDDGLTLATVDPPSTLADGTLTGLDASWSSDSLPAGSYRFSIDGVGNGNPLATGYSDYGSVGRYSVTVHTTACPLPGPASSVQLGDAAPTSLQLRWSPPSSGGPVAHYQVRRGSGSWVTLAPSARSYRFRGLLGSMSYGVTVRAVNSTGAGPSVSRTYKTDPPVRASAPRIAFASSGVSGGAVNAKARWYAPTNNGGAPIRAYRVYALRTNAAGTVLWKTYRTVSASSRSYLFALPRGAYRFQAIAMTKVGASKPSARSNLVAAR